MVRPRDYGDQYPSDQNDTPPNDPTAGYTELDYQIDKVTGKSRSVETGRDFFPDQQVSDLEPPEDTTFAGIITEWVNELGDYPRTYKVLLNNGKLVEAEANDLLEYETYLPGDSVMVKEYVQGKYGLVGHPRPKESQIVDVCLSKDKCSNQPFIIPFDVTKTRIPQTSLFSDPEPDTFKITGGNFGTLIANQEEVGIYEIQFTVTLQVQQAEVNVSASYIDVQSGCFVPTDLASDNSGELRTNKLWFNKYNGFIVQGDPSDCSANVSLGSEIHDTVLNQKYGEPAMWTNCPRIGGHLYIATELTDGWLKIGSTRGGPFVWLSHGGAKQLKFRFPKGPPTTKVTVTDGKITPTAGTNKSFLIAEGVAGNCVLGGWMPPGATGSIEVFYNEIERYDYCYIYCCENPEEVAGYCSRPVYKTCTLTFDAGLVQPGDCLSPTLSFGGAICNDGTCATYNPCS